MGFGLLDSGEDGHIGFVEISQTFVTQAAVFILQSMTIGRTSELWQKTCQ